MDHIKFELLSNRNILEHSVFHTTCDYICILSQVALMLYALFIVRWNVRVLSEVGMTVTSYRIQLSTLHILCFVTHNKFVNSCLFHHLTTASWGTACPQPPYPQITGYNSRVHVASF